MRKRILLTIVFILIGLSSIAAQESNAYKPEVFGVIKLRYEIDAYDGYNRFNMNNTRVGVKGLLSPNVNYSVQAEMSAKGKVELLDAWINYRMGAFRLSAGQQQYHFSTEVDRGPGNSYFANSSFIGSYITQYYYNAGNAYNISSIGSRDMGATLTYSLPTAPVKIMVGAFNGAGINTSQWSDRVNFVGRVSYGAKEGFGAAASYYHGSIPAKSYLATTPASAITPKIQMWAGELRYTNNNFIAESEIAQRFLETATGTERLTAAMVHALYRIDTDCPFVRYVAPAVRWDYIDNLRFIDSSGSFDSIDTHRVTAGIAFGLANKLVKSEIRLNYEHFLPRNKPADISVNRTFHNKFMVEFIASF